MKKKYCIKSESNKEQINSIKRNIKPEFKKKYINSTNTSKLYELNTEQWAWHENQRTL